MTPAGTKKLDGCYVDCFTGHNPPETLDCHVLHSRWVQEVKKGQKVYFQIKSIQRNFFQSLKNKTF